MSSTVVAGWTVIAVGMASGLSVARDVFAELADPGSLGPSLSVAFASVEAGFVAAVVIAAQHFVNRPRAKWCIAGAYSLGIVIAQAYVLMNVLADGRDVQSAAYGIGSRFPIVVDPSPFWTVAANAAVVAVVMLHARQATHRST